MRLFLLIVCGILLRSYTGYAQSGSFSQKSFDPLHDYTIQIWNSGTGLPQNTIQNIIQTRDGYVWLSTINGLARFNGSRFETFDQTITPGLPATSFLGFYEDSQNGLWLISWNHKLAKYANRKFHTVALDTTIHVQTIYENENKEMVVGAQNGCFYRLEGDNAKAYFNCNRKINTVLYSKGHELYIATENGLFLFNNQQLLEVKEFSRTNVYAIADGGNSDVYVYSEKGLFKIEGGLVQEVPLPDDLHTSNNYYSLLVDEKSRIWLATQKGVLIIDGKNRSYCDMSAGLSSNSVSAISKDREGNIWVGTLNSGLNKLTPKTIRMFSKETGLIGDLCGPIVELQNKAILVSHCETISKWENGIFSLFNPEPLGCVWTMLETKNGEVWLGGNTQGVYLKSQGQVHGIYKYVNGKFIHLEEKEGKWNLVSALLEDREGNVWMGCDSGLFAYRNMHFVKVAGIKGGKKIVCLMQDSKKRIWFCSDKGLGMLENNQVIYYTVADGLPVNGVLCISEDREGGIWIGTNGGGLSRFKDGKFFNFNKPYEIIYATLYAILEDSSGTLWFSSDIGIYSAKRSDLNDFADGKTTFVNVRYYGEQDGMKSTECNGGFQGAGVKLKDGKLCFPTVGGLALVDPQMALPGYPAPAVRIDSILQNDKSMKQDDSVQVVLPGSKLELFYSAPFQGDKHNLLFQYKLEGVDGDWSPPSSKCTSRYLQIRPGTYVFHARVYGNLKEATVHFRVPPPFWQSAIFIFFLIFLGLCIILTFVYLKNRQIRKREAARTEINKQYAELELRALQAQMNPHFMFNCLNSIKYFIATNDGASASIYLSKFSQMIRLFLENSNSNSIKLKNEINLLTLYIEMEKLRLEDSFLFQIEIDPLLDTEETEVPSMLLQPFVENAIHHGLRNGKKNGILKLYFGLEGKILKIAIDDNGVGREKARELKQQSNKEHASMGMSLTKERVATINFIENTHIEIQIEDKVNSRNEAEGTTVLITIPLNYLPHDE